jgi:hypothetical protein
MSDIKKSKDFVNNDPKILKETSDWIKEGRREISIHQALITDYSTIEELDKMLTDAGYYRVASQYNTLLVYRNIPAFKVVLKGGIFDITAKDYKGAVTVAQAKAIEHGKDKTVVSVANDEERHYFCGVCQKEFDLRHKDYLICDNCERRIQTLTLRR